MDAIITEFKNLEQKQINKPLISSVDRITSLLEETKRKIQNGIQSPQKTILIIILFSDLASTTSHLALLKAKYTSETSKILEYQKDSHKAIASCTKALQNVT